MQILVDADACPVVVREILFRAAQKRRVPMQLLANQPIPIPRSEFITMFQVAQGFDAADDVIVERTEPGDLVITSDIPLAADVLAKEAFILTPRGERYTLANIKQRLQMRDFMETMRASGEHTGGQSPYSQGDRKAFADQLDRLLTRLLKSPV